MAFEEETKQAKELALRAGAILLDHYSKPQRVNWKGPGDPVTAVDRAASDFLAGELKRMFPRDGILCEERQDDPARLEKSRVWMIDPIDGTVEFIAHIGEFAVMIGLAIEGILTLGVVYQPTTEKLYYAASGTGAFLEKGYVKTRLRVSSESNPSQMTIALSRSHRSPTVDLIRRRIRMGKDIISGSLGLKIGLICEKRADLYLHTDTRTCQWDTCAPEAILREAGGRMTDLYGAPLRYNRSELCNLHGVIACSGAIHDQIVEVARGVLGEESVSART
jgi:3'(2'), 5'-bisphosphate nucleotidase